MLPTILRRVLPRGSLLVRSTPSYLSYVGRRRAYSDQVGNGESTTIPNNNSNSTTKDDEARLSDRQMLEKLRLAVTHKPEGEVFPFFFFN